MEDVFLYCRVRPPAGLSSLLRTAQNLLEPFPCRTAPVFTPWFPSKHHQPPLRPARPPPTITCIDEGAGPEVKTPPLGLPPTITCTGEGAGPEDETPPLGPPAIITCTGVEAEPALPDPPLTRSWMVSLQRRGRSHCEHAMSKRLRTSLSVHKLHPLQRARWVIHQENCGSRTDLEQVWRVLRRTLRTAPLPSCTATIQRDRAEVWVFCDLQRAEHVGRHLKGALQLDGCIRLSVRTVPDLLSM